MTRINANIDPADLCDQHLIAEYREMVRIPNFVLTHPTKLNAIPDTYRLGTGHVNSFITKYVFYIIVLFTLKWSCIHVISKIIWRMIVL